VVEPVFSIPPVQTDAPFLGEDTPTITTQSLPIIIHRSRSRVPLVVPIVRTENARQTEHFQEVIKMHHVQSCLIPHVPARKEQLIVKEEIKLFIKLFRHADQVQVTIFRQHVMEDPGIQVFLPEVGRKVLWTLFVQIRPRAAAIM
jgi:hypothetical protein